MKYLSYDDLLQVAARTLGTVEIRDAGLLRSALYRPMTSVAGADDYPTLALQAAALLHSIARNHGLADGNKRLGARCDGRVPRAERTPSRPVERPEFGQIG